VRTCTTPGQEEPDVDRWSWTYSALPAVIARHPCDLPNSKEKCPVKVPNVVGMSFDGATAKLAASGFLIANNGSVETGNPNKDGTIATQSTTGFLKAGSTIKVTVYVFKEPPDEGG